MLRIKDEQEFFIDGLIIKWKKMYYFDYFHLLNFKNTVIYIHKIQNLCQTYISFNKLSHHSLLIYEN